MKIVRADVIVTCPGRNFVTLKIVTDEGVHGIGDATLNGRELAVASREAAQLPAVLQGSGNQQLRKRGSDSRARLQFRFVQSLIAANQS